MAIVTILLGAFLGLYINHIFTWKIKDKIAVLDEMSKTITELADLLPRPGMLAKKNDITSYKLLFMKLLFIQRQILKDILSDKTKEIFNNIESGYNEIKWNRKPGEIEGAGAEISLSFGFEEYQEPLYTEIIEARKKITSLRYIRASFLNWQTLVVVLLGFIFWLLYNCFCSPAISVIHLIQLVH